MHKSLVILFIAGSLGCQAQQVKKMETNTNPLLCDPETGICEIPGAPATAQDATIVAKNKAIKIIYFTDPICSTCWAIEPQLRKLKLEYGHDVEIEYHMGGLLPDWSYNSGGISKPSDVAHHWDEVSAYYQMPIDGDVWLEDPLDSSFPPSIAFKAAQLQDGPKALSFLRIMREMVFLQKKNIAKWEVIAKAAEQAGLDVAKLKTDYSGAGDQAFKDDLALARKMGVRGFPSIFITDKLGNSEFVYGNKPYAVYETALGKMMPVVQKMPYQQDWESMFAKHATLTTREFAELTGVSIPEGEKTLKQLNIDGKLTKFVSKNGPLWWRK